MTDQTAVDMSGLPISKGPKRNTCTLVLDWIILVCNVLIALGLLASSFMEYRTNDVRSHVYHPWVLTVLMILEAITVAINMRILVSGPLNDKIANQMKIFVGAGVLFTLGTCSFAMIFSKSGFSGGAYIFAIQTGVLSVIFWTVLFMLANDYRGKLAKSIIPYYME
jgi:MFS family permease